MSEHNDVMMSLENVLQEIRDPELTKKRKVNVIPAAETLISKIISSMETEKKCIYFKKLSENAHIPTYGSEWAAGADLYSAYDCVIPAKNKASVGTDLQVEIPRGYYGRIAPRSGLTLKKFIDVGAGVIDSDYRGHLNVVLFNFANEDFQIKKGDRIAQFICEKISHCEFVEVESLEKSGRDTNGFGSTGGDNSFKLSNEMNVMMEKKNAKEFQSSVAKLLNKQITAPRQKSKKVKIYKNGDNSFEGLELIISMDQFKSMQAFLDDISKKIGLTTCAKKLYTLNGELIQSMEQIDDNKEYVAATNIFIPLLYGEMKFITNSDRISRKNSGNSIKMAASRNSRSVDLKKERRKENTAQRKSKSSAPSQNTQSIGNITSKDKKKKTTKVQKEHTVAAIAVSDLSQSTKKAVAKFASTSSTSTTIPTIKRSNVAKMTVKMNPTPLVISEGMSKQSSLSAGQRPSTTSIKNRVPTPKPAAKILKSNENSNDDEDSTNEQS